ncbi:MAG TPA: hypothetical protein VLA12_14590 [Planctomycetaceae bacterium]|nr:hypothetical protein [Planctomycetaceae bacterium]
MPNKTHYSLLFLLTFVYSTVVAQDKLPKEAEAAGYPLPNCSDSLTKS